MALAALPARAELLHLSLLKKSAPPFALKRDIFNGDLSAGVARAAKTPEAQQAQAAAVQKSIAEEIFQSVIYEGFVVKNARKSALLNVSGEFYMVGEGDRILDKITVLTITRSVVTIEYENVSYEIRIKGDENG